MNTVAKTRSSPASSGYKEQEVDRISKLQDELIHYILSFIDTRFAVQTCVLSKRWINIWKSLPYLNFDFDGYAVFKLGDTIDRVFKLRDKSNIQWFRLRYNDFNEEGAVSVSRWMDFAVDDNVQEVKLEIVQVYINLPYKIPPRLFKCKSLKKLTLWSNQSYLHILLPESMSLPQLEYMCLGGIIISNGELSARLFSGCPLLERLNTVNFDIETDNQNNFTVQSLSLKEFSYTHSHYNNTTSYLRYDEVYKPKFIMLSAPNLTSFTCTYEDTYQELSTEEKEANARYMVKLLAASDKVERLDLSPAFLEVLSRATDLLKCQLHRLCNLQFLKMETLFTGGSLRVISHLLTISPNIRTLILKISGTNSVGAGEVWEGGLSLPGTLSHLNVVRIEGMVGSDAEIKLVSFLLKNSKGLDEVDLFFRPSVGSPERERQVKQFRKKVKALPRASSNVYIAF